MDLQLAERVYVISGGSRGLGRATAEVLTAEGARVVLVARDETHLQDAAEVMGREACLPLVGNLRDPEVAVRAVATAKARFGRLDGALLSVGGPPPTRADTTTDEQWREAFEDIFVAPLRLARTVAAELPPGSERRDSSIAFILSTSAVRPVAGLPLSNGLRPGLLGAVRDLANEYGARGIRVNALAPGRIATDRIFALDARSGAPEAVRRKREASIPLGRYGEPEEFGRVAAFVLSPAASYVSGDLITVDGGATFASS